MCAKGRWKDQEGRVVTENGSLGKGSVKGSVFPGEGMRYLEHGGRALVQWSTRYFQCRLHKWFQFCLLLVWYSTRYANNQTSNETSRYI